ncbi:MAG: D-alanyl-D-alanine carboxypeptidase [Streptosporangiaceae bacterium]
MGLLHRRAAALTTVSALLVAFAALPARAAVPAVGGPLLASRGLVVPQGAKPPIKVKNASWVIADGDTGDVLAAQDAHGHYLPASTQKVLTAITLIPKVNPDQVITPTSQNCVPEGTKVGMTPKLAYRTSDLFKALMMVSANDAAMTLTQAGGGYRRTLASMNAEAKRLGAVDTLAGSPNGLDVDLGLDLRTQHTSSYDLALQLRAGLKIPKFVEYAATVNARFPALTEPRVDKKTKKKIKPKKYAMPIYSHIRLLPGESQTYPGFVAGKNGYTNAAGQTFVGAARRNGKTIIVALMHAESLWGNAKKLLDYGFAATGKVVPVGRLVDPVGTPKPSAAAQDTALPASDRPAQGDGDGPDLVLVGVAGAFVLAGIGALVFRRRRSAS